jgi:GntR family transcriptional regulator
MIDRSPSLTDQVKAHLKERIVDGDFDEGRIPSETELATELGVSRTTIRDALSRLEQEGAIWRKQGSGTFVNQPGLQIKSRLEEMWAYEDVLEDHGYTPSVKVLRVEREAADRQLAGELNIDVGDPLVVVEKLFLENRKPVVLTVNRIPAELVDEEPVDGAEPLPQLLETRADRHLSYYLSEIVPVALSVHAAKQLGVKKGTPAISFEEIGFDQDNQPVVQATSFFHDDLLRFRLIRRKSGA